MGNRAVVSFGTTPSAKAVYLHWNGGRASVEGFLRACALLHLPPTAESLYEVAKGFLGSSCYLETVGTSDRDNYDNGWYVLEWGEWRVKERKFNRLSEEIDEEKTRAITIECLMMWWGWQN